MASIWLACMHAVILNGVKVQTYYETWLTGHTVGRLAAAWGWLYFELYWGEFLLLVCSVAQFSATGRYDCCFEPMRLCSVECGTEDFASPSFAVQEKIAIIPQTEHTCICEVEYLRS